MKHDNDSSLEINQQERIKSLVQVENYKYWLGGFVEGEGALVVSIAKNAKVTHGLALQPEFNVGFFFFCKKKKNQHENGINILYSFKVLFGNVGSVHRKSGSEKV